MWQRRFLSSGLGWQQLSMAKLSHLLKFIVWLGLKELNVTGLCFRAGFLGGTRQVCSSSEKYLQHICRHWGLKNRLWDWRNKSPICSVQVGSLPTWVVSQGSSGCVPSPAPLFHTQPEGRGAAGKAGGKSLLIYLISPGKLLLSHVVFSKLCPQSFHFNFSFLRPHSQFSLQYIQLTHFNLLYPYL